MVSVCVSSQSPFSMKEQAKMIAEANGFYYEENTIRCKDYDKAIYLGNINTEALSRIAFLRDKKVVFYTVAEGRITTRPSIWIKNTEHIVAPSNFAKAKLEEAGLDVCCVIPHGVRIPKAFIPISEKKGYLYRAYYQKRKFPDYGIEALKKIQKESDVDIFLTGMPLDKQFLQKYKVKAIINKIVNRAELEKLYDTHRFYLNLSDNEGFGLTPLEAMSFGEVVITAKYPTIMEYLPEECNITVDVKYIWNEKLWYEWIEHYAYDSEEYYRAFLKSKLLRDEKLEEMSLCNVLRAKEYDFKKIYKKFEELV